MDKSQYIPPSDAFKALTSPTEQLLTVLYGDLHDYIPNAVNEPGMTVAGVARRLNVSNTWLQRWLRDNGYQRRYVRVEADDVQ
jgi:hypothetical protein